MNHVTNIDVLRRDLKYDVLYRVKKGKLFLGHMDYYN